MLNQNVSARRLLSAVERAKELEISCFPFPDKHAI